MNCVTKALEDLKYVDVELWRVLEQWKGGWVGWVGGPSHYSFTPTWVEVELGCDNKNTEVFTAK